MVGDLLGVTLPGPPPRRPIEPRYVSTTHLLHLILTILTAGLWAIVWVVLTLVHRSHNERARYGYEQALARWEHDMWMWDEARRAQGRG